MHHKAAATLEQLHHCKLSSQSPECSAPPPLRNMLPHSDLQGMTVTELVTLNALLKPMYGCQEIAWHVLPVTFPCTAADPCLSPPSSAFGARDRECSHRSRQTWPTHMRQVCDLRVSCTQKYCSSALFWSPMSSNELTTIEPFNGCILPLHLACVLCRGIENT